MKKDNFKLCAFSVILTFFLLSAARSWAATFDDPNQLPSLNRDMDSTQLEISKVATNGGDATSMKTSLLGIRAMVSSAQDKTAGSDTAGANILLRQARLSLDSLDDSADSALDIAFDGSRKTSRDYGASMSGISADLKSLSATDSETENQIKAVANSQYASITPVQNLIAIVATRQGFVKFLIGSNSASLDKLSQQVDVNKKNIDTLKTVQGKVADPAESAVLQTQIQILQQQTATLEAYIQINVGGYSLFGWFLKYL